MKVSIIGQGYVGVSLGQVISSCGFQVIGIENNLNRINQLQDLNYKISNEYSEISDSNVVIIAVPTPITEDGTPDISFIKRACESASVYLKKETLVINESTSYPGTLRNIIRPILGPSHNFVAAPERVDPGNNNWNIRNTPRVIGALSEEAMNLGIEFYSKFVNKVVPVPSAEVAEAAKLFENTFRQVNIALVNEFALFARSINLSANEIFDAADTKTFGFMKFIPGIGVGGHCIPVDPYYLTHWAESYGYKLPMVEFANQFNAKLQKLIAKDLNRRFQIKGKKIQVVGISYKSNTSDIRESPSIKLLKELRHLGAIVNWHDPLIDTYGGEVSTPLSDSDLTLICVIHDVMRLEKLQNATHSIINFTNTNYPWAANYF